MGRPGRKRRLALEDEYWTLIAAGVGSDPRTRAYAAGRTTEEPSSREIKRRIKRYIARELYPLIVATLTG